MKLFVDRLTETPTEHRFEADREWLEETHALLPEVEASGPSARLEFRAYRLGADVCLEGRQEAELQVPCSRCLETFRQTVAESFRLVLEPAGHRRPADPEAVAALERDGLCLGDELESGWFQGKEIDLGAFAREVLALGVPVKPLCREDCRGLCPRCGADLNQQSCACPPQNASSPFAALEALRGARKEGDS